MTGLALSIVAGVALLGAPAMVSPAQSCPADTITGQVLGEAMQEALVSPEGSYSILATTNSVRFQSAVFQHLIDRALKQRLEYEYYPFRCRTAEVN